MDWIPLEYLIHWGCTLLVFFIIVFRTIDPIRTDRLARAGHAAAMAVPGAIVMFNFLSGS